MTVSRWGGLLGWCCLLGLVLLWGCRRESPSSFDSNLPPETYISRAPAESTLAYYRIHLYWNGEDPDGLVDHFEYAVTDSNKTPGEDTPGFSGFFRSSSHDSVFSLRADNPQVLGHRFYVRAVDNEGKVDPTPAWAYFIAHDFNFPNVVFHTQIGRWTDRDGNERTITLRSSDRYSPTDTIGVGGEITVSWGGYDVDPGGSVVGFEYHTRELSSFVGGTLADTMITVSFEPSSTGKKTYFSGTEAIQVRAIDDAGAKTQPDSIRSVVVNFSPVTWIVDPEATDSMGRPVRNEVFQKVGPTGQPEGRTFPSGSTLAWDGSSMQPGIQFYYTAFDDPRDKNIAPDDSSSGISGFSYRKLRSGGGGAYATIRDWVAYPNKNLFAWTIGKRLGTGNYSFLVRAKDLLGRWGKPAIIRVNVNYMPYFTSVTYFTADGEEKPLWIPPTSGESSEPVVVHIPRNEDGTYPDFHVRFTGLDEHHVPPNTNPLDVNDVLEEEISPISEFRARLNGATVGFQDASGNLEEGFFGERFFPVSTQRISGSVSQGENVLLLAAKDAGERAGEMEVDFIVVLGQ